MECKYTKIDKAAKAKAKDGTPIPEGLEKEIGCTREQLIALVETREKKYVISQKTTLGDLPDFEKIKKMIQ